MERYVPAKNCYVARILRYLLALLGRFWLAGPRNCANHLDFSDNNCPGSAKSLTKISFLKIERRCSQKVSVAEADIA